jgi:hypothetical protein
LRELGRFAGHTRQQLGNCQGPGRNGGLAAPRPRANWSCAATGRLFDTGVTAAYQYGAASKGMKVASNGGQLLVNGVPATATESASIDGDNFQRMGIWFDTLMRDTSG